MNKLTIMLLIGFVVATIAPAFAQETANDDLGPIQIEFTGILTYEDVDSDGGLEILVGGVVISPLPGFDANAYPAGQQYTVRGYLGADDTLEAATIVEVAEGTLEPTLVEPSTDEASDDERDRAEDEREREEEQREREEERREEERERDEEQRRDQTVVEISGQITAVTQNFIVVEETEVSPGGIFQPSQFEVGQWVIVSGVFENNGVLRALRIEEIPHTDASEEGSQAEANSEATVNPSCISGNHPVVTTLASEFAIPATSIVELHCAGIGFGDITRALLLSERTGTPPAVYVVMLQNGQEWGQIARNAGFEPRDVSPEGVINGTGQGN